MCWVVRIEGETKTEREGKTLEDLLPVRTGELARDKNRHLPKVKKGKLYDDDKRNSVFADVQRQRIVGIHGRETAAFYRGNVEDNQEERNFKLE